MAFDNHLLLLNKLLVVTCRVHYRAISDRNGNRKVTLAATAAPLFIGGRCQCRRLGGAISTTTTATTATTATHMFIVFHHVFNIPLALDIGHMFSFSTLMLLLFLHLSNETITYNSSFERHVCM
jgi:hypothetical protein